MELKYFYGKLDGRLETYWENGQMKRRDIYENGEFIKGGVWNDKGKELKHFKFKILAIYPGGYSKFYKYLNKDFVYPPALKKKKIEGAVEFTFVIRADGSLGEVKILESTHEDMTEEVIRLLKGMAIWKPGSEDGDPVNTTFSLPLSFTL